MSTYKQNLRQIAEEFERWGVQYTIERTKHLKIRWQVPGHQPRQTVASCTPSCPYAWPNKRAELRRMFKADGLVMRENA